MHSISLLLLKTKLKAGAPTSNIIMHLINRISSIHFPQIISSFRYHTPPTTQTISLPTPSVPLKSLLTPPPKKTLTHHIHIISYSSLTPSQLSPLLPQESSYPFLTTSHTTHITPFPSHSLSHYNGSDNRAQPCPLSHLGQES